MTISSPNWSDSQKSALVQQIIEGGMSLKQACAQYDLSTDQLKEWVCIFRRSMRQALDHQLRSSLSIQGLEIEELSRAEFSGNLADIGVAHLLQTIQLGRQDAHVTLSHDGIDSHIWCQAGEVVDAQSGALHGEDALYRILAVTRGSVVADFSPTFRSRSIESPTPTLLLESASRHDQRQHLVGRIGDLRHVFCVLPDVAARQAADLGPEELYVLSLFDGGRSLDDVVLASELPDAQALEIAVRFYEAGMLAPRSSATAGDHGPTSERQATLTAMSYRPFVGTVEQEPKRRRPPTWMLAVGAALCSSLGAASVIAYAGDLEPGPTLATLAEPTGSLDAPVSKLATPSSPCPANMAVIHAGKFRMGSDSSHPVLELARPAHPVSVDSFCLGIHEVTVDEYSSCVRQGECEPAHRAAHFISERPDETRTKTSKALHAEQCNAGKPGRERHPINCISHPQAAAFCAVRGARLPSEAEWEFAARGESRRLFPWGDAKPMPAYLNACGKECEKWHIEAGLSNELHGVMYEGDDGYSGTAPVGSFPMGSTSDGVMDLIGNVFEWTSRGPYSYHTEARVNPLGPPSSDSYVIRGGNFNSAIIEFSDPSLRFAMHAESYSHGVGFRCARSPEPAGARFFDHGTPPAHGAPTLEQPDGQ